MSDNDNVLPVAPNLLVACADGKTLLGNLAGFGRLLRHAGLSCGPGKVALAARALCATGIADKNIVREALCAVFVQNVGEHAVFQRCFELYFGNRGDIEPAEVLAPSERTLPSKDAGGIGLAGEDGDSDPATVEGAVAVSASGEETLAHKDFERMTRAERTAAGCAIEALAAKLAPVRTRRLRSATRGKVNPRATARRALRTGGVPLVLSRSQHGTRNAVLVALCDISGSMSSYSRMFAHFLATLPLLGSQVHTFVFGTQLTKLSAAGLDSAAAAEEFGQAAPDWGGGTRIAECVGKFNQHWSRRLLSGGAEVVLATDGLERDIDRREFARQTERLAKSCRRLWWLNPLLRYDGYEALAAGAQILARCADEIHSIHNVHSIAGLAERLSGRSPGL